MTLDPIFTRAELAEIESQLDSTVPYYMPALMRSHRAALDKIDELRNLLRILGHVVPKENTR